jgi:hypothetical protein
MLIVIFMFLPLAIGALRFTHVHPVKFHDIKRRRKKQNIMSFVFSLS